jgi:peptidoglycan/LPS O-acetylase OafA/YrhL
VQADLAASPLTGLALGFAGAMAVIAGSALLARADALRGLRYAGRHSLSIYLAFFLPMAMTRMVLIRWGWIDNIDVAALLITATAIALPLAFRAALIETPFGFLFLRPRRLTHYSPGCPPYVGISARS